MSIENNKQLISDQFEFANLSILCGLECTEVSNINGIYLKRLKAQTEAALNNQKFIHT